MELTQPQILVLGILLASLALLVGEILRYDLVALVTLAALVQSGSLSAQEAFACLASETVVAVGSLGLIGAAIARSGVGEALSSKLIERGSPGERGLTARLVLVAAVSAAFMSDAAVVAALIPIATSLGRRRGIALSRLLLPISFGAFLGDMLVVVGSAKNLAVNGVLAQSGVEPFGMFEYSHYGLILLSVGGLMLVGPVRALLPRGTPLAKAQAYSARSFTTAARVEPLSTFINRALVDLEPLRALGIAVVGMQKKGSAGEIQSPDPHERIQTGDVLILRGAPAALAALPPELGLTDPARARAAPRTLAGEDVGLVEAVILGRSPWLGETLARARQEARDGLRVVGAAHGAEALPQEVARAHLRVGDTLLVEGARRDLFRAREERELVIVSDYSGVPHDRSGWLALAVLAGVLACSTAELVGLASAAFAGALLLILAKLTPLRTLYRDVEWPALALIGGMLALGKAFDQHELARPIAQAALSLVGQASPQMMLAVLMALALLLSQVATAVAASVILTPVALSLASQLGVDHRAFVLAVLTGANCSFLTPSAHPAGAMVVGPGQYRPRDYLRVGTPMALSLYGVALLVLPRLWPFAPG